MRLLNIETSPRGPRSASIAVSDAFIAAYRAIHPDVEVDTLNVWNEQLPEFDSQAIEAKYKGVSKERMNDAELAVWQSIQSLAQRFQDADRIVLGVPMWNFAYPYKLKHLIDLACQRDFLFTFDGPLVRADKAFAIFVRGQSDEAGFATTASPGFEHQTKYLEFWLRFIGVRDVAAMTVEHTWDGPSHRHRPARKSAGGCGSRELLSARTRPLTPPPLTPTGDPTMSTSNGQLTLIAFLTAKPGQGDELGRRLMALSGPARAEAGNINYDLHRSNDDPDAWAIYENWKSSADLDAHFEEGYMKAFVASLGEVLQGEMDLRRASMVTKVAAPKS